MDGKAGQEPRLRFGPSLEQRAYGLGYDHGKAAGSWVFDGNTDQATYRRVLDGLEDGDPEVLDSLPTCPLSGEWADSYSLVDLADDLGVSQGDDRFDDLASEFEAGFSAGVSDEVTSTARAHVEGGE